MFVLTSLPFKLSAYKGVKCGKGVLRSQISGVNITSSCKSMEEQVRISRDSMV